MQLFGCSMSTTTEKSTIATTKKAAGPPAVRLLDKHEVMAISNCSYPTLWAWMRAGTFPRSRIVGGKSMWLSTEIAAWLAQLPVRRLKGDPAPTVAKPMKSNELTA
jgi:predicted DNA-binding transcriptional regulator AlpA